jgi:hypothetical protein
MGMTDDGTLQRPRITEDPDCILDPVEELVPDSFLKPQHAKFVRWVKCRFRNFSNDCPWYTAYMGE